MRISYDDAKRDRILAERGLDLAAAAKVFDGFYLSRADTRHSGEEPRTITVGMLDEVVVLVVWTPREGERRIITMWKVNEKERRRYHEQRERHG